MKPSGLARVDLFNHGLDDIAVANAGSSTVSVFRNRGDGTFAQVADLQGCQGGSDIDGEDLTGRGYGDLLLTCHDHSVLSLFVGDGGGGFVRKDIQVGEHPLQVQAAPNVSGAGTPYLGVLYDAPARLELFFNQGGGSFTHKLTLPTPGAPSQYAADIFTPDGSISYAVVSAASSGFSVYLKSGADFERKDYEGPERAASIASIDLRATGLADLAIPSGTQNYFRTYLNDGSGHFNFSREYSIPGGPVGGIGSSHFRGSPHNELAMQSAVTGDIVFYPSIGKGELGEPEVIHAGTALTGMITGHFAHHSDDMDIAAIDPLRGELLILLNERGDY